MPLPGPYEVNAEKLYSRGFARPILETALIPVIEKPSILEWYIVKMKIADGSYVPAKLPEGKCKPGPYLC